eukprot:TRINITY_DN2274_c3_g1_i1.p1 TRINITY_DN2274_c3_g1~~TRINITY_DN2274_c3_g1_i1.p1  ORF type:complete len:660 (-),score=102.43 TRINITY_DN2274_c3_g1_i1:294-2273(-)
MILFRGLFFAACCVFGTKYFDAQVFRYVDSSRNVDSQKSRHAQSSRNDDPRASGRASSSQNDNPHASGRASSSRNDERQKSRHSGSSQNDERQKSGRAGSSQNDERQKSGRAGSSRSEDRQKSRHASSSRNDDRQKSRHASSSRNDGIAILAWNIFDPMQGDSFPAWQIKNADEFPDRNKLLGMYNPSFCHAWLQKMGNRHKKTHAAKESDICDIQKLQDLFASGRDQPGGIITQIYVHHVKDFKDWGYNEAEEDDSPVQMVLYRSLFWARDDKLADALKELGETTHFKKKLLVEVTEAIDAFRKDMNAIPSKNIFAMSFESVLKLLFPGANNLEEFREHVLAERNFALWKKRGPKLLHDIKAVDAKVNLDMVILSEQSADGLHYGFPLHKELMKTWRGHLVPTGRVDDTYFDVCVYWRKDRFKLHTHGYWDLGERDALEDKQTVCTVKNTRAAYLLMEPLESAHEFYGKTILIVASHLNTGSFDQDGSALRLANYALSRHISDFLTLQNGEGTHPVDAVVLLGDMNSESFFDDAASFSKEDRHYTIIKKNATSLFTDAVPRKDLDGEKMYTYAAKGHQRLDHVLYYPKNLLDADFDASIHQQWKRELNWPSENLPSDHEPTVVRFHLKPGVSAETSATTADEAKRSRRGRRRKRDDND